MIRSTREWIRYVFEGTCEVVEYLVPRSKYGILFFWVSWEFNRKDNLRENDK